MSNIRYCHFCPSTKDAITDRFCIHCSLYIGSTKSKQNHSSFCRTNNRTRRLGTVDYEQHGGTRKVQPQRVVTRCQGELLCVIAFQELECHAIDDVDFDAEECDISEIVYNIGTLY